MTDIIIPATITVDESYLIPMTWDTGTSAAELSTGLPVRSGALVSGVVDYTPKQIFKINIGPVQEGDRIKVQGYAEFTNDLSYLCSVVTGFILSNDTNDVGVPNGGAIELSEFKGDNVDRDITHHHVATEIGWRTITSGDVSTLGTGDCYVIYTAWSVSTAWSSPDEVTVDQDYGQMTVERRRFSATAAAALTLCSQAEAEAGIENTKFASPLRVAQAIAALAGSGLPSQTGNNGKFLSTNGSAASWNDIPAELPSQASNSGKFLKTNGTAASWDTPAGGGGAWTTVAKTSDEQCTSDTSLNNDSTLLFTMAANTKYAFRLKVFFDTPAAADFKFGLNGPASPTLVRWSYTGGEAAGGGVTSDSLAAYETTGVALSGAGSNGGFVHIDGVVHNGANAGDLHFSWCQNSSSASATKVLAKSYLEWM